MMCVSIAWAEQMLPWLIAALMVSAGRGLVAVRDTRRGDEA